MKNKFPWKSGLLILLLPLIFVCSVAWVNVEESCEEVVVTKLLEICTSNVVLDAQTLPYECHPNSILVTMDEECQDYVPMTIYCANIIDYPLENTAYPLPEGVPPFYIQHEISPNNSMITGPYETVILKGQLEVNPGDFRDIFGADLSLYTLATNVVGCDPKIHGVTNFPMNVRLMEKIGATEYIPYDLDPYSNPSDGIFPCDIFQETNCLCDEKPCTSMIPNYDLNICLDCQCVDERSNESYAHDARPSDQIIPEADIDQITVRPNPFNENFNLDFSMRDEATVQFTIMDAQGRLITKSTERLLGGSHSKMFNTIDFNAGLYYIQIVTGDTQVTKKLIVL